MASSQPQQELIRYAIKKEVINLALQGGGAHGAFTWGVVDRLLEDERLRIEGISGISSGAMNAVALAYGLTIGGRKGARQILTELWDRIGINIKSYTPATKARRIDRGLPWRAHSRSRTFSPRLNLTPLNQDPLREIVTELIDFKRLRAKCR
jgi:NTE family protein